MAIDPKLRDALKRVVAARERQAKSGKEPFIYGVKLTSSAERMTPPIYDEEHTVGSNVLRDEGLLNEANAVEEYQQNK